MADQEAQGPTTHNELQGEAETAILVGTHHGDNHFHLRRKRSRKPWKRVAWVVGAVVATAVATVAALMFADRPEFKDIREFTPPPAVNSEACAPDRLCAYRGVLSYSPRFDLVVADDYLDVCLTVRADDPGFETLVKGSTTNIDLYPGRRCTGQPQAAPLVPGNSMGFHFYSYVVRQ